MKKIILAVTLLAFAGSQVQSAKANGWPIAAGVLGGVALGTVIAQSAHPTYYYAQSPVYYPQQTYYYAPAPAPVAQTIPNAPMVPNAPTMAPAPATTYYAQPTTTYVYTQPAPTYVYAPPVYTTYYDPLYVPFPFVGFGFGFGRPVFGGFHGGFHGGGFHGGGGGFHHR